MSDTPAPQEKKICHLPQPRKRDVIPFVLAAVILLCGVVIGMGGTILFLRYQALNIIQHPEELPDRITNLVQNHYSLDKAQTEEVRVILNEHLRELEKLRQDTRPIIDTHLDAVRDKIAVVMGEERGEDWRRDFEHLRGKWLAPFVDLSNPPMKSAQ